MSEKAFIQKLLDIDQPMETNPTRYSSLALILRGGRKLSGYDVNTGTYQKSEFNEVNFLDQTYHSFQFSGLINYLILLEQLGSIFKPKKPHKSSSEPTGIYCALTYFTDLDEEKKYAIKALRNSLTHKFGLATENKGLKSFKFTLSSTRNSKIVNLGQWDGDFSNKSESSLTTIFMFDFIDLVEIIYKEIVSSWNNDSLDCLINSNEIKARYTIQY